jgi:hypothetical protein
MIAPLSPHFPSPALPIKGRVPLSGSGTIESQAPIHTLPFMGRAGEGESALR